MTPVLPKRHPRRAEIVVAGAGRQFTVQVFEQWAECTCRQFPRRGERLPEGECDHVRHALRLLREPARVALEAVIDTYIGIPIAERDKYHHQMYGTAVDLLDQDNQRISHHLAELDRALDPRTDAEKGEDAIRHFQALGPSRGKGYSRADRDVIRRADEADLLAQLKDAGPDTTIIRRP